MPCESEEIFLTTFPSRVYAYNLVLGNKSLSMMVFPFNSMLSFLFTFGVRIAEVAGAELYEKLYMKSSLKESVLLL